ncbi:hypothetical protein B0O99DRAFT_585431 [Bisporella sp. PMI_857]|nr:hypothetical protein B0O99DRAFT_585431 [Bisporella sp. PMI_857]
MSLFTATVHPGQALGFLVLGASLHDILTRLKAEPQQFPKIDVIYEPSAPVKQPVTLDLPTNGVRLRFDGPEQRLRLIEVLDFTKNKIQYKDREVFRPATSPASSGPTESLSGPSFKHIYKNLIGPTFPGEYIGPDHEDETGLGLYILSYPGVAFSFPMQSTSWQPGKDMVSLLSSSTSPPAASMAIFSGDSWSDARETLYTHSLEPLRSLPQYAKSREPVPDEVNVVRIHGEGRLELVRPLSSNFWIQLGQTSPQELVAELGPPDAIYRKSDQRMAIHNNRVGSGTHVRSDVNDLRLDDSTDTDQSSAHTATDDSEDDNEDGEVAGSVTGECFYNYFYHGFDILISTPIAPSQRPPSKGLTDSSDAERFQSNMSSRLVASKVVLHGNVPGSYPFNRHRRCRWEIEYLIQPGDAIINSETPFQVVEHSLHEEWKTVYKNAEEAKNRQRGMVLNRDWGDSPGSSCELLGGWEDTIKRKRLETGGSDSINGLGNTTLFGFPGLVFEVLKNGAVSGLTVF